MLLVRWFVQVSIPYGNNDVMRVPLLVSGFRAAFGGPLLNKIVLCVCLFSFVLGYMYVYMILILV